MKTLSVEQQIDTLRPTLGFATKFINGLRSEQLLASLPHSSYGIRYH
jgi:hypothetical protein